jgi:hypothetical protein
MAILITQNPTIPNMANNTLLFTVTSSQSSQPQFQYVADLTYSGSNTVLQRIKQQPNPSSYGVFDFGQIISNYLESDNNWKSTPFTLATNVAKRFQVKMGEEYASSISGSPLLYTGYGPSGNPAVTASAIPYLYTINGLVDPYDKVNWNFPSASYYTATSASAATTFSYQHALTNAPLSQSIQDGEYATISVINGNFDNSDAFAQDIFLLQINVYNSAGSNIQNIDWFNTTTNGGGPRTTFSDSWFDAGTYDAQTAGTQLLTIGVGPQNFDDAGQTLNTAWAYYDVKLLGQGDDSLENNNGVYANLRYVKEGAQCGYDGVRFAWKNEFGVWDYYTFTLQNDKAFNIERQSFDQSFVPFNTSTTTAVYNKERRGTIQFYNKLTQTQTANSDWLTQQEADWLKELFFSANVFQQVGTDFFPIAITSANLVEKTNPRTQKVFQYQIEFKPANQLNPRL